ncbi:MAG: rhodanese-like domain-containing protein, partial [Bacilli bacterium]|nr:rhodanese-like domain-containing protein [Bacilli bacterium]
MKRVLILGVMCLLLCSCGDKESKEIKPGKINCSEMKEIMEKKDDNPILIDVRTKEEYEEGHLEDSINIPVDSISSIQAYDSINFDTPIIVYCRSGNRSARALEELKKIGYTNVYDLGAM